MIKTITIGDKEVTFKSSAAIPHIYRRKFGRDVFLDMSYLEKNLSRNEDGTSTLPVETLEIFENLAYCFAVHADPDHTPETPEGWLAGFEIMDIWTVLPQLIEMWNFENKSTSSLKKKKDK